MKRLKKNKRSNARVEAVVPAVVAYPLLLNIAAQADAGEGIRQGFEDTRRGRTRPALEVFDEIRAEHDIPR